MELMANAIRSVIVIICVCMVLYGLKGRSDKIKDIMVKSDEQSKRKTCFQSPKNKKASCD
jgi:hypothetical protein